MNNKKLLGKRIKQIRKNKGYTQETLAGLIGIETSSLSGIESGRFFPSLHVLEKMSAVLNTKLPEFFMFDSVDIPINPDYDIEQLLKFVDDKNKIVIYKIIKSAFAV